MALLPALLGGAALRAYRAHVVDVLRGVREPHLRRLVARSEAA